MILLDTNVILEMMRPEPEPSVMLWLREQALDNLAVSSVTVAEISYGLARLPKGKRKRDLENRFRKFVEMGFGERVMAFDKKSAEIYGEIVFTREKAGKPIEAFDAMIVATAISCEAGIATRDTRGFEGCGIEIINTWKF